MSVVLADVLQTCDTVAKALLDLNTTFVTNPTNTSPTVTQIEAGLVTGSPSLLGRIAGFANAQEQLALLSAASAVGQNVTTTLTTLTQLAGWYPDFLPLLDGLEFVTAGLGTYLAANGAQVHGYFAQAFNYYASAARALGYVAPTYTVGTIAPAQAFVPQTTTLATFTVGAGTPFTGGLGAVDGTQYAPAPLALIVYPGGVPGSPPPTVTAHALTVTYVPSQGAAPATATVTPSAAAQTPGTAVALGVSGLQVLNITAGPDAGTNDTGFTYTAVAQPLRAITSY